MRPDVFAAWLTRLLPGHTALIALSGEDWNLYLKNRETGLSTKYVMPGAGQAAVKDLVNMLTGFKRNIVKGRTA